MLPKQLNNFLELHQLIKGWQGKFLNWVSRVVQWARWQSGAPSTRDRFQGPREYQSLQMHSHCHFQPKPNHKIAQASVIIINSACASPSLHSTPKLPGRILWMCFKWLGDAWPRCLSYTHTDDKTLTYKMETANNYCHCPNVSTASCSRLFQSKLWLGSGLADHSF